jgi:hypothetical protein
MRPAIARARTERGSGRIGVILSLIVVAAIGYALMKYIPVRVQRAEFVDFCEEKTRNMIALQGTEEQLQIDILDYAKKNDIPLTEDTLVIDQGEKVVRIRAHYVIVQPLIGGKEWKHFIDIDKEVPRI